MSVEVKAWKCEHCNYTNLNKYQVNAHTKNSCYANPALRACQSCSHYDGKDPDEHWWLCDGEPIQGGKQSYCDKWEDKGDV